MIRLVTVTGMAVVAMSAFALAGSPIKNRMQKVAQTTSWGTCINSTSKMCYATQQSTCQSGYEQGMSFSDKATACYALTQNPNCVNGAYCPP